ncbi:MAG: GLUG motif-containing protein [Planctomycetota bacterium]
MNNHAEVSIKICQRTKRNNHLKLIYLLLLILLVASPAQAKYSGGTGEPNNPYRIADANDMNEIGTHFEDYNAHFVLINDINLAEFTGTQFNMIGGLFSCGSGCVTTKPFTGVFDGNGFEISNFTYSNTESLEFGRPVGLFGYVYGENAIIKNLGLKNAYVHETYDDDPLVGAGVSSLVGTLYNGNVSDCYVLQCDILGTFSTGGLIGYNSGNSTISNCYATGMVTGLANIGGLIGENIGASSIDKCSATVSVTGDVVGGLVGVNQDGLISNCYAAGAVDGTDYTGGLVGINASWSATAIISNCYATGLVEGNEPNLGGLVGYDPNGLYTKSFWDNDVNPDVNGIGNKTDPNVIGKSTVEMKKQSTFIGWDFVETWGIGENQTYPYLRVYPAGDLNHDGAVNFPDFATFANHWLEGN